MSGKKILIVEDEAIVAVSIKKKLEKAGYEILDIVSRGEDAVAKALELQPNILLMDIKLKGKIDGVEAAEKIRESSNIPIIYLTAFSNEETLRRAKITSPYGYIVKPINERELYSNIEIALYKHRMESELKLSEEKFRYLAERSNDIIFQIDKKGNITYCSPAVENILGFKYDTVEGENIKKIKFPENKTITYFEQLIAGNEIGIVVLPIVAKDKKLKYLEINSNILRENNKIKGVQGIGRDITDRKILEDRQNIIIRVLELLNKKGDKDFIIIELLKLLKTVSKLDGIGIRIKEGDDYPFTYTEGYSNGFLKTEDCLCSIDSEGSRLFNDNGVPYLNCLCGKVIMGGINTPGCYFTKGGSFWTNSVSTFLHAEDAKDLLDRPHENLTKGFYQSFAIIPLKSEQEIIGIMHMAYKAENMLSRDMVQFYEGIGDSIAMTIDRKKSREELQESLEEKERLLKNEKRLIAKERQLQKEINDAIHNERQRIGRDLHDGLGQNLTAIGFLVEVLFQKLQDISTEYNNDIEEIDTLVAKSIVQTKVISRLLNPVDTNDTDFLSALEGMAANISRLFNIKCKVKCNGCSLPADDNISENLFFIVTEAINNSIKHGSAKNIEIIIKNTKSKFNLIIQDDGTGLKDLSENNGMGMKTMRHRASLIDAAIDMINNKEGFKISVSLPL